MCAGVSIGRPPSHLRAAACPGGCFFSPGQVDAIQPEALTAIRCSFVRPASQLPWFMVPAQIHRADVQPP